MAGFPQVCFIKDVIANLRIIVGDHTYYADPDDPEGFERNVFYHYPFSGDLAWTQLHRGLQRQCSSRRDTI